MSTVFSQFNYGRHNSVSRRTKRKNGRTVQTKYRITVMGAAGVGKSCIISQFLHDKFLEEYNRTVEDMYRKQFEVSGKEIVLDILDTAGAYPFPAMRKLAISVSDALILVYTAGDDKTFEEVIRLREEIRDVKRGVQIPIIIVANKADLNSEKPEVDTSAIETMVSIEWENTFVQASAKDNHNIAGIFIELLRQLDETLDLDESEGRARCSSMPSSRNRFKNEENSKM